MALFSLPFLDLPLHSLDLDDVRLRTRLSKGIDELSVRVHEIKEYGLVDKVVVTWFGTWWC